MGIEMTWAEMPHTIPSRVGNEVQVASTLPAVTKGGSRGQQSKLERNRKNRTLWLEKRWHIGKTMTNTHGD